MTWELRWHPFRGEWVLFTAHRLALGGVFLCLLAGVAAAVAVRPEAAPASPTAERAPETTAACQAPRAGSSPYLPATACTAPTFVDEPTF